MVVLFLFLEIVLSAFDAMVMKITGKIKRKNTNHLIPCNAWTMTPLLPPLLTIRGAVSWILAKEWLYLSKEK